MYKMLEYILHTKYCALSLIFFIFFFFPLDLFPNGIGALGSAKPSLVLRRLALLRGFKLITHSMNGYDIPIKHFFQLLYVFHRLLSLKMLLFFYELYCVFMTIKCVVFFN